MPVMGTVGAAAQQGVGKGNYLFRPPVNVVMTPTTQDQSGSSLTVTYQLIGRNIAWTPYFVFGGVSFYGFWNSNSVSTYRLGGNYQFQLYSYQYNTGVSPTQSTKYSPIQNVAVPPTLPYFYAPVATDPNGYLNGYLKGTVYNGGGASTVKSAANSGTVTYNILKDGAAFASNVSMPYSLTHTGSNGTLAVYTVNAVGNVGGTTSNTWSIKPFVAGGGEYIDGAYGPGNGTSNFTISYRNNNIYAYPDQYYTFAVSYNEKAYCSSCGGCETVRYTGSDAGSNNGTAYGVVLYPYLNDSRMDNVGGDTAFVSNLYYASLDKYANTYTGVSLYGDFGSYEMSAC